MIPNLHVSLNLSVSYSTVVSCIMGYSATPRHFHNEIFSSQIRMCWYSLSQFFLNLNFTLIFVSLTVLSHDIVHFFHSFPGLWEIFRVIHSMSKSFFYFAVPDLCHVNSQKGGSTSGKQMPSCGVRQTTHLYLDTSWSKNIPLHREQCYILTSETFIMAGEGFFRQNVLTSSNFQLMGKVGDGLCVMW